MADVAAKDGSQETALNLLALIVGLFLIPWINMDPLSVWIVFLAATFFHIYSNYMAVTSVIMETVNNQRLRILVTEFLATKKVLTPAEVATRERLFDFGPSPRLGVSVGTLMSSLEEWRVLTETYGAGNYLLRSSSSYVSVAFRDGATTRDVVRACFEAHTIVLLSGRKKDGNKVVVGVWPSLATVLRVIEGTAAAGEKDKVVHQTLKSEGIFEEFEARAAEAGWNLQQAYLRVGEWRLSSKSD